MSGQPSTDEDGAEGGEDGVEETERTKIDVSIGNLSISVENHDREACEEQFYRIYDFVLRDVDEWSRAMDSVVTQEGGFR
ncbi:hypothetical protein [Halorubrum laminariae]|uniref:Uncharacterized protein n=1 Tax=Halorubrum laminariae TaxID=1433523 RepID=A0ABD6C0Y9_9EURY|nr:hypothetical protein [Halorubrum laminariae]